MRFSGVSKTTIFILPILTNADDFGTPRRIRTSSVHLRRVAGYPVTLSGHEISWKGDDVGTLSAPEGDLT